MARKSNYNFLFFFKILNYIIIWKKKINKVKMVAVSIDELKATVINKVSTR